MAIFDTKQSIDEWYALMFDGLARASAYLELQKSNRPTVRARISGYNFPNPILMLAGITAERDQMYRDLGLRHPTDEKCVGENWMKPLKNTCVSKNFPQNP